MQVIRFSHTDIPDLPHSVLAMGFFDGFHRGHQALLQEARQQGTRLGLPWGVLTFDPDPWTIFRPEEPLDHIQTLEDRERTAQALGADLFCILEFSREFASLSPQGFHEILQRMHADYIVTGFDFHYGSHNAGSTETLREAGFAMTVVKAVEDQDGKISSTRVEAAIREGQVAQAAAMLGQDYSVAGTVVKGYQRGSRLLAVPTANLQPDPGYIIPKSGVYAGYVLSGTTLYPAMINIGNNPTFGNRKQSMEAFLFGFSGDLYGAGLRFFFSFYLRPEQKFESVQALQAQLEQDAKQTLNVLQDHQPDPLGIWHIKSIQDPSSAPEQLG